MRHLPSLVSLLLLNAAFAAAPTTPSEVVAAFHAAMAAGQAAEVEKLLLPEVQVYEFGHVERNRAEYVAKHLPEDLAQARTSSTRVLQQQVLPGADLVLVSSETETLVGQAPTMVRHAGTETLVLRRDEAGQWRIAHIHWSSHKVKP
ncbi:nuclear transport factor 2 family protein [Chitinimonas sp.]|uniref:YybH family protein n=1 Tax=Chitinimonas sp. TaxID=1934313 RepID=UPI0035B405F9